MIYLIHRNGYKKIEKNEEMNRYILNERTRHNLIKRTK